MKSSRRKASKLVGLAFIGTSAFFAGCGDSHTTIIERRAADRVEVVEVARPGFHYSYYYGGYVPVYVPIMGYSGPGYYSGGYRAPRTVVNNYTRTHTTTVVRPPAARSSTATTTTRSSTPTTRSGGSYTSARSGAMRSTGTVRSGGFGSIGRGSASIGG